MTEGQTPAQIVAADYVAQYTDEDFYVLQESQDRLKAHIEAAVASALEFATHILPGRPSRPQKPTV